MKRGFSAWVGIFLAFSSFAAEPLVPSFNSIEIDKIEIGYGVAVADVDGDNKPDIVLADKRKIVWYKNPEWRKFVIAENLTKFDNVCVAAQDIDGDGKAEIAVGAEWNPSDTVNSGAVFYLIPPKDRTRKWEAVKLQHEPTVHRMRWVRNVDGGYDLVVVPLHGRGNKDGQGTGVKILAYKRSNDPRKPWKTEVVSDSFHLTHNFTLVDWAMGEDQELLIGAREGIFYLVRRHEAVEWKSAQYVGLDSTKTPFQGAGEVRIGKLPGGKDFIATIEPMHGNEVVVYSTPTGDRPTSFAARKVVDSTFREGHALACGDVAGMGSDQVVAGWRGKNSDGKVGIKLFIPLDADGEKWKTVVVDDNAMACEDLCLADINGDGKLDIVAAGRATKNLKVYFNLGAKVDDVPGE